MTGEKTISVRVPAPLYSKMRRRAGKRSVSEYVRSLIDSAVTAPARIADKQP